MWAAFHARPNSGNSVFVERPVFFAVKWSFRTPNLRPQKIIIGKQHWFGFIPTGQKTEDKHGNRSTGKLSKKLFLREESVHFNAEAFQAVIHRQVRWTQHPTLQEIPQKRWYQISCCAQVNHVHHVMQTWLQRPPLQDSPRGQESSRCCSHVGRMVDASQVSR